MRTYMELLDSAKHGEEITITLSFLTDKMNRLLNRYLNILIKRKYYRNLILEKQNLLKTTEKMNGEDSVKSISEEKKIQIEKEIEEIEKKYDNVKFLQFDVNERNIMSDIRKKFKKIKSEFDETNNLTSLFEYLELNWDTDESENL